MSVSELSPLAPLNGVSVPGVSPGDSTIPADCDRRIAEVYRYWHRRQPAPDVLPGRQHISPSHLSDVLRHLWLCDIQRQPLRFRYRLVGTAVVHACGDDMTGQWLDQVHEKFVQSAAYADFLTATEEAASVYYKGRPLFHLDKDYIWIERLVLPLARDGKNVDMLMGITVYGAAEEGPTNNRAIGS